MSRDKLKACPFCGGKVYLDNEDCYGYEHIDFFVHCDNCSLQFGFASQFETEEEAAKAWNTRKPIEVVVSKMETEIEENQDASLREYRAGLYKAIEIVKEGGIDEV